MAVPTFYEWMKQRHYDEHLGQVQMSPDGMTPMQQKLHKDYMDKMAVHKRMAHARHMKKMKAFMKKSMGIQ